MAISVNTLDSLDHLVSHISLCASNDFDRPSIRDAVNQIQHSIIYDSLPYMIKESLQDVLIACPYNKHVDLSSNTDFLTLTYTQNILEGLAQFYKRVDYTLVIYHQYKDHKAKVEDLKKSMRDAINSTIASTGTFFEKLTNAYLIRVTLEQILSILDSDLPTDTKHLLSDFRDVQYYTIPLSNKKTQNKTNLKGMKPTH